MAGPYFDAFVFLGGSGATLGLLIALLVASKKRKQIVALGMPPGVFQINEPVLFGLPVVLNPIWLIPFISTPIVLTITSYLAIDIGLVHPVVTNIPWVTPPIIGGYLATGAHLSGAVMAGINLIISIAIYLPFVIMQERIDTKKIKEQTAEGNNNLSV
jgi:PTS system cellobiose-specific IIC component